jgi:hypothetical protein
MRIYSNPCFSPIVAALLSCGCCFGQATAEPRKPAVLFIIQNKQVLYPSHAYKVALDAQGYAMNAVLPAEVTPELLRQYNSVILFGVPIVNMGDSKNHEVDALVRVVRDYAKEGGGVLFNTANNAPEPGYGYGHAEMAKAFGARLLWEPVHDTQETGWIGVSSKMLSFAYTAELNREHPITKGLKGIWYNARYNSHQNFGVLPWLVDTSWTTLVTGSSTSYSTQTEEDREALLKYVDPNPREEGFGSYVPIIVARDFHKGRVVMNSIHAVFHLMSGDSPGLRGIVSDKGYDGRSSDVNAIIFNSIKWLCEPSLSSDRLGGAVTPPGFMVDPMMAPIAPQRKWTKEDTFGAVPKQYRGIMGVRTVRSQGASGTVEEYVAAAKESGLDFLVFMEDWNDLSDADWASLSEECKKATVEGTFYAFPGLVFKDTYDGNWFAFDRTLVLPPKDYERMIEGYKRFMNDMRYTTIVKHFTPFHEWAVRNGRSLRLGSWRHKEASYPYYACVAYQAMAVISAQGSRVDEEMIDEYLHMQNRGDSLYPVAMTVIMKPEDIKTELQKGMYINVMTPKTIENMGAAPGFASYTFLTQDLRYLSNGPLVNDFRFMHNFKDYSATERWRTDYYQQRLRISVSSENGLEEVRLMDGARIFRRWFPKGQKQFLQDLVLANAEGRAYVVIVKDREGKQAISSELHTRNLLGSEFMCADRVNQLGYGAVRRRNGRKFIFQPVTTPNKGVNLIKFWGDYSLNYDPLTGSVIRGVDGQDNGTSRADLTTVIHSKAAGSRVNAFLFNRKTDRVINSPDVVRGWGLTDGRLELGDGKRIEYACWNGPLPVTKAEDYQEWIQRTMFGVAPDLLTVEWIQRRLSVLEEMDLKEGPVLWNLGVLKNYGAKRMAIRSQGNIVYSGAIGNSFRKADTDKLGLHGKTLSGILAPGDYVVFYDGPISNDGFMVYEGQITFRATLNNGFVALGVDRDPNETVIPAGTEVKYSLLGVFSPNLSENFEPDSFQFMEDFRDQMGLDGDVTYTLQPSVGSLVTARYVAVVEASDGAFVAETEGINLPATLPLEVRGLNSNWSTGFAELDNQRYRPINNRDGTSYVALDPQVERQHFFVGHPAVSDDAEIVLNCVQVDTKNWHLEIHNPSERDKTVTVRANKAFPLLQFEPIEKEVKGGSSVHVAIETL